MINLKVTEAQRLALMRAKTDLMAAGYPTASMQSILEALITKLEHEGINIILSDTLCVEVFNRPSGRPPKDK